MLEAKNKTHPSGAGNRGNRGREAETPEQIPGAGWRDIMKRTWQERGKDNLSLISGGVAFYLFLAIFPALAAAVSIYGLVAEPAVVESHLSALSGILPQSAYNIIDGQLKRIVANSGGALGIGLVVGVLAALWSAAKGMKGLMAALNIVYDEEENRSFVKFNAMALLLTLAGVVFGLISLSLIAAMPAIFGFLGFSGWWQSILLLGRWPLLAALIMAGLAVLYRYAPSRDEPRIRWASWGAAGAAVLWIVGSLLFSYYVSNFGSYNETYGSMGAIVILMMWFYLTAFVVLMGAEVNAEMERQTRKDTTRGAPRPMGRREAHAADTVGGSR